MSTASWIWLGIIVGVPTFIVILRAINNYDWNKSEYLN